MASIENLVRTKKFDRKARFHSFLERYPKALDIKYARIQAGLDCGGRIQEKIQVLSHPLSPLKVERVG